MKIKDRLDAIRLLADAWKACDDILSQRILERAMDHVRMQR